MFLIRQQTLTSTQQRQKSNTHDLSVTVKGLLLHREYVQNGRSSKHFGLDVNVLHGELEPMAVRDNVRQSNLELVARGSRFVVVPNSGEQSGTEERAVQGVVYVPQHLVGRFDIWNHSTNIIIEFNHLNLHTQIPENKKANHKQKRRFRKAKRPLIAGKSVEEDWIDIDTVVNTCFQMFSQ